jgi:hypothetical protein
MEDHTRINGKYKNSSDDCSYGYGNFKLRGEIDV